MDLCGVNDQPVCRYSTGDGAKKEKMTIRRRVCRKIPKSVFYFFTQFIHSALLMGKMGS
jgi:hypothetical protein